MEGSAGLPGGLCLASAGRQDGVTWRRGWLAGWQARRGPRTDDKPTGEAGEVRGTSPSRADVYEVLEPCDTVSR